MSNFCISESDQAARDKFLAPHGLFWNKFESQLQKIIPKYGMKFYFSDGFVETYRKKDKDGDFVLVLEIEKTRDAGIVKRGNKPGLTRRSLTREDNNLPYQASVIIYDDTGKVVRHEVGPKILMRDISLDNPVDIRKYAAFLGRLIKWIDRELGKALAVAKNESIDRYGDGNDVMPWDSIYVEVEFLDRLNMFLAENGFIRRSERFWVNLDTGSSVRILENDYPNIGDVFFDGALVKTPMGEKRISYQIPDTFFSVKNYNDILNMIHDGIVGHISKTNSGTIDNSKDKIREMGLHV